MCLNEQYQPFRLRSMVVENFSPDLEKTLRSWSDSFLAFHPAFLVARGELKKLEHQYPLFVDTRWSPLHGTLHLTAIPFVPAIKLEWQHAEYLASEDGTVWPSELWSRSLSLQIPQTPVLKVGSSFPLLESSTDNAATRLKVRCSDLLDLQRRFTSLDHISFSDLELFRRGGEDIVSCVFKAEKTKKQITFLGRVTGLDKSLLVVKEVLNSDTGRYVRLDATYADKIIIKKDSAPRQL